MLVMTALAVRGEVMSWLGCEGVRGGGWGCKGRGRVQGLSMAAVGVVSSLVGVVWESGWRLGNWSR